MKVRKTAFFFEGDTIEDGLNVCDTVDLLGSLWLVPEWIHDQEKGVSKPARMICLSMLEYQKSNGSRYRYVLNKPIPKAAFDGSIKPPQGKAFLILENPQGIEVDTHETCSWFPLPVSIWVSRRATLHRAVTP